MALRGLPFPALDVQIAAHVAAGNLAQAEQAEHQMRKVLTHAGADLEEVLGRRVVRGDVLPVLEPLVDVRAEGLHLLAERRGRGEADRAVRGAEPRPELHRAAELEEVAQRIGQAVARWTLGERRDRHAYRSEERRVGKECRSRWSPYH